MYFEFESLPSPSGQSSQPTACGGGQPLSRRHRLLSLSSQSLSQADRDRHPVDHRRLVDQENVLENIEPSQCNLYLLTRKKLSMISSNCQDLRKELLLSKLHRSFINNSLYCQTSTTIHQPSSSPSSPSSFAYGTIPSAPMISESPDPEDWNCLDSKNQDNFHPQTIPTATNTTTFANLNGGTHITVTSSKSIATPSSLKKRSSASASNSPPKVGYEGEWTYKRLKVVHGHLDMIGDIAMMDQEFRLDNIGSTDDLNDLTTNFHRLKTPFT